ncbi:MAG TPA: sugar-transfer associated ATP-grasp domain-containing protein [Dongiaceae bacterium]|nr:sugar-transfer associated ATP-grasp domain-containing protein [Dongiaceae bacterium]
MLGRDSKRAADPPVTGRIDAAPGTGGDEPLGRLARRLYAAQYRSNRREIHSKFHKNMRMRFALLNNLQRAFTFWRRHSGNVRRQRGVSQLSQLAQLLKLVLVYRADPAAYYALNLYEPPRRLEDIEDYVGRHEVKNGLYSLMRDAVSRGQPAHAHSLTNKATFAGNCLAAGLPHIPILASARGGVFTIHDETPGALDRDLFVKLTSGKGTLGARPLRWLGDGRYADKDGTIIEREALFKELAERSNVKPLIVNPWLRNHPEIADLAKDSLLTFRVFTCLDPAGEPRVTHGFLRIMSKLEPSWGTIEEYGSKIDLDTGRMNRACADRDLAPDAWWDVHPKTGAQITGRVVSVWPAIAALAVAAHREFRGWAVIGWDIAATPDGPVLIEGNSDPDPHYLQRVHRETFGRSPIAPLLRHHLAQAEALLKNG